ncbi:MAG TPA: chitobiase/beta-hexosaminidase C-terminal domain-containing protein [Terracidiphilus sp.]|nr:chitobiase/beta-hexosaminidase C-terminal domain-containing protein [Terracidiphilus sp.]
MTGGLLAQSPTPVPILTWRYDLTHAGDNMQETALTPANVASGAFGKLFSLPVDDRVFAQPLYVPNLIMSDGRAHNVLFVATEDDSIYAFDADTKGNPIWKISLLTGAYGAASGATPVPQADVAPSEDIGPNIGITGTPAINLATNTMYVVSNTKENGQYFSRLHAINIITGAEQPNGHVNITATVTGTGDGSSGGQVSFLPLWTNQRAALDYYNGYVYIAYSSHGDISPYHGWLFAYNASTLQQTAALCLTPYDRGASVWGSGAGMPIDTNVPGGRMFVVTGNGGRNTPFKSNSDYGESVLAFNLGNGQLTPSDEWSAFNYDKLNTNDWDQGSGGLLMLPDQPGSYPHLIITAGKEGRITLLNRDNLGGIASGTSSNTNAVQDFTVGAIPAGEGFWGTAAYWNGNVYVWAGGDDGGTPNVGMQFKLNNGVLSTTPSSKTTFTSAFPDPTFSVSSNGTQNGIVWAVKADQFDSGGPAVLYAFDADDISQILYESDKKSSDTAGPANKFSVPVVTNGKVYFAAKGEVDVYGLLNAQQSAAAPVITPDGGTFASAQTVTISSATASASIYYTIDGSTPSTSSTPYTGPITVSANSTINAIATASGYAQSSVSTATFTFSNQTPPVSFSPAAGTYGSAQSVTLSDSDANATIYYTTDGSAPSASSTKYAGAISVQSSETINAIAVDPTLGNSVVSTASYVIQAGSTSIDFSKGFASIAGLTLNGSASINGNNLELTNGPSQAGSVFWNAPINVQAFTTTFDFQLTQAQANGFTFTIQNTTPTALGGDSAGLGYQDIPQSVAVKFNFYNYNNEGSDSTGFYTDGQAPVTPTIDISPSGIQLNSGDVIQAQVTYDGTTLTLNLQDLTTNDTFTTSTKINIPQTVGGTSAYVGFTGGTGGLSAIQDILNWTYTGQGSGTNPQASFTLSSSAVPTVSVGSSGTAQITVTPSGGFTGDIILSCAVTNSPAGKVNPPTCTVSQPQPITGSQPTTATLTVNTTTGTTTTAASTRRRIGYGGGGMLAAVLLLCVPRRRKWQTFFALFVLVIVGAAASGCGSAYKLTDPSSKTSTVGTTPGTYTITVTGTDMTMTNSTTVSVTVQ